jgi:UDP-glucose 4-epimerase
MTEDHLILGGCGFIGRHVALLLAREGHRVILADRVQPHNHPDEPAAALIDWRYLELGSADWDDLLANVDVVHHYAWGSLPATANANPLGDLLSNVGATIAMLDALARRGAGRIIFASSGGTVYGRLDRTPVPEDHSVAPITAYGAGKATAETYLGVYRFLHGLDCRIARIANPYGAGQDLSRGQGAVTTFLHHALIGHPITIWGTGEIVRDYIHISDVARGLVRLAAAPKTVEHVFNIGSGTGTSLNDIVRELELQFGPLAITRTQTRPFDVPVSILDITRAHSVLGWSPRLSFAEGMEVTIEDLRSGKLFSTL